MEFRWVMCVHIIPLSRNVHLDWKIACPCVSLLCIVVVVLCLPRVEMRYLFILDSCLTRRACASEQAILLVIDYRFASPAR
mgnify:CR=1 FL=1